MASASPAYRLDPRHDAARESARVRAVRTGGSAAQGTPLLVTAARLAAVVLAVIAVLSFARIALTSATVSTMRESDALSGKIEEARSAGVGLEMEQSVLANSYAISASAKKLGMAAPAEVGTIALAPDVMALTDDGQLSLSGSVANLVGAQG